MSSTAERAVPMRVIVCGLHRTGTLSMQTALKQLGFNDTYHMRSVQNSHNDHSEQWIQAFEGKYTDKRPPFSKADWDNLLGEAQACCDLPAAIFSCELAEIYPEAKVVILNRDPEKWYASVLNTVDRVMTPRSFNQILLRWYTALFDPDTRKWDRLSKSISTLAFRYDHAKEKEKAIAWFQATYDEFRKRIPIERRIEYNIEDGWEPLCKHLCVPVPMIKDEKTGAIVKAPFPRVNDMASHIQRTERNQHAALVRATNHLFTLIGKATVTGALGYGGYLMWKTRLGSRL